MKVEELRAALVNVPGITEVTVWRDDENAAIRSSRLIT